MGIFHSKIAPSAIKVPEQPLNNQLQDPRSPTVNINRSPIGIAEILEKPIITKVRDLTADLTEILDNTQTPIRPENAASSKLQSLLDPRSPSSFDRTPLMLSSAGGQHDESNASNVGLCGTSLEYEEISCDEGTFSEVDAVVTETPSLFSDISLNTELKADIECIIQGLHDASGKDPRSPSINIQRTPIVFEEKDTNEEKQEEDQKQREEAETSQTAQDKSTPIVILQDENVVAAAVTPVKEKLERLAINSAPRTPLGCVTNVKKTPANMRKTALFGQMKQNNATAIGGSAEIVAKKPLQTRISKIPTLRMK
ncbi:conserved hypothetical protein [Culex quinquefasciatus]|uniref:Uncharacterized protein n=1 Tax=Culex quinquefasciatus TaxID=7176 RepID=B0WZP1_CULQU|nr:conserved hypothetical protein [Culex quinquefasciatus]|eukprot:XP_001862863.1 conserved hypothetical protein [Culex quinquefasciatus]